MSERQAAPELSPDEMCTVIEFAFGAPAFEEPEPIPTVGYLVSKPGFEPYQAGDQVTIRAFATAEERDAAIAAAFAELPAVTPKETP